VCAGTHIKAGDWDRKGGEVGVKRSNKPHKQPQHTCREEVPYTLATGPINLKCSLVTQQPPPPSCSLIPPSLLFILLSSGSQWVSIGRRGSINSLSYPRAESQSSNAAPSHQKHACYDQHWGGLQE